MSVFKFGIEYETLLLLSSLYYECEPSGSEFPCYHSREKIAGYLTDNKIAAAASPDGSPTWLVDTDVSVMQSCKMKLYRQLYQGPPREVSPGTDWTILWGVEIISPPFEYSAIQSNDTNPITQFTRLVSRCPLISYHNDTTSTHIHYSFPPYNLAEDPMRLFSICMTWWYFEPILLKLVPYWRRADNDYCMSFRVSLMEKLGEEGIPEADIINTLFANEFSFIYQCIFFSNLNNYNTASNKKLVKDIISFFQFGGEDSDYKPCKYKSLNLLNLVSGKEGNPPIGTLEVRLKHGSSDGEEICKYIELYGKLLSKALDFNTTDSFFSRQAPSGVSYREILIDETMQHTIHFAILCEYMGSDNAQLMNYFNRRLDALAEDPQQNTLLVITIPPTLRVFQPLNQQQQQTGGGKKHLKYKKTTEKVYVQKRNRIIYTGTRGGKYVKINDEFIPLTSLKRLIMN
jgi:hypothetical protein